MFARPGHPPCPMTGTARAPLGRVACQSRDPRPRRDDPFMRIGLVSDTHDDLCDWPAVCGRVSDALAGVDQTVAQHQATGGVRRELGTHDPQRSLWIRHTNLHLGQPITPTA